MSTIKMAEPITSAVRHTFIRLPQVARIMDRAEQLIETNWDGSEPDPLVVLGETGVGKSTLLLHLLRKYPRIEHETFSEIPVLYVEVPARSTIPRLCGEMQKAIGLPFQISGDDGESALITLIKECKIKLVVLDEMNHLVERGKSRTHYNVGDWVKQISHKAGASFLLAGTPRSASLLKTNEQLGDRFAEVVQLRPLKDGQLVGALKVFQTHLEGVDSVDFTSGAMVKALGFATGGRLRAIRRLLIRAIEIGFRAPTPRVDVEALSKAFGEVIYPDAPVSRNPFSPKFDGRPLTKAREPFAPRVEAS
jgi:Cdc6-like AAA superfamily ATPase